MGREEAIFLIDDMSAGAIAKVSAIDSVRRIGRGVKDVRATPSGDVEVHWDDGGVWIHHDLQWRSASSSDLRFR